MKVESYEGLTVNFCEKKKANYLLRGIRSSGDFEYEKTIAHLNHDMLREIRVTAHSGYALGDNRFRDQVERTLRQRATPRGSGRPAH